MGFKDSIHALHEDTDLPVLVTEEVHQVFSVDGFKRKSLPLLLDTFAQFRYQPILNYRHLPGHTFDLQKAGRLSTHIQAPACIPLRLEPIRDPIRDPLHNDRETIFNSENISPDTAIQNGKAFFGTKFESLQRKIPDDWQHVCEYMGRLMPIYKQANIDNWPWYLCTKSGTTLNFHLMPDAQIDPAFFMQAKSDCRRARVNTVTLYPFTIEIVFHAFSKVECHPFNRRHRIRYDPYTKPFQSRLTL